MSDPIATSVWPVQAAMRAFYGPVGANLVPLVPPFVMTYDGKPIHSFVVNMRCRDSLLRVLTAIWETAGKSQAVVIAVRETEKDKRSVWRSCQGKYRYRMSCYSRVLLGPKI